MNPNSTTQHTQSDRPNTYLAPRPLRPAGAADAQGFAQIMQAFAPAERPPSAEERQGPARADDPADHQPRAGETDEAEPEQNDETSTESTSQASQSTEKSEQDPQGGSSTPDAVGDDPAGETPSAQVPDPATTHTATASRDEIELRLLHIHSDQAKLSMKGLVRSMTREAAPDLTTVAVETRLGKAEPIPAAESRAPAPADAPKSEPLQHPGPNRHPSAALSDEIPDSPRDSGGDRPARDPVTTNGPDTPVSARPDQARTDVQQARSVRADASAPAQTQPSARTPAIDRLVPANGAEQAARVTRVESSANSVRAVTANDPTQAGTAFRDTGAGTLAGKVARTTEPVTLDRTAIMAQVQRGLASMMRSGKGEMTLKLTPGHLGEVRIRIKTDGDRLAVRLETSTGEASELLGAGAKELAISLRGKGMQLEHFDIQQRQPDHNPAASADAGGDQSTDGNQTPDRRGAGKPGAEQSNDPLMFDDEPGDDSGSIWTELGLDAIA